MVNATDKATEAVKDATCSVETTIKTTSDAYHRNAEKIAHTVKNVAAKIVDKPFKSVGIAMGMGLFLGACCAKTRRKAA